tara:strand:+ start:256 stop:456 length:201 start_codon:yes stop_codon:yes gene_type:complete
LKRSSNEKQKPVNLLKRIFPIKYAKTTVKEPNTGVKNLAAESSDFSGILTPGIGLKCGLHKGGFPI